MAKNLKLNIKGSQIAKALKIGGVKKKKQPAAKKEPKAKAPAAEPAEEVVEEQKPKRVARARSRSAFEEEEKEAAQLEATEQEAPAEEETAQVEAEAPAEPEVESVAEEELASAPEEPEVPPAKEEAPAKPEAKVEEPVKAKPTPPPAKPAGRPSHHPAARPKPAARKPIARKPGGLGPTGRHIRDLLPKPKPKPKPETARPTDRKGPPKGRVPQQLPPKEGADNRKGRDNKKGPGGRGRDFRDLKPSARKMSTPGKLDSRDRYGLRTAEEGQWRRRRQPKKTKEQVEAMTVRPDALTIRVPISIKDLASQMKLKSGELIGKLFMQGIVVTINDFLDDETTIALLGEEFKCAITIDTSEEERIRITDQSVQEEISSEDQGKLHLRPPVVTFMGHVDHGKTSLIDKIRSSNVASGEAGAITQHVGAFLVSTDQGDIAFLDTPGHEAFSAMRARGAEVTDIVVLVIAGDEGMRQQTLEAIQHAKAAGVTIIVAVNKCDKPVFNADDVYRQLSEQELLPEAWGGQTITVNCSAVSGEGLPELLEMLALQAEVLELRANPEARARGTVIESEMQKGLGSEATVMVQNGTLKPGDSVVFSTLWGRVKTMRDDVGNHIEAAGPSHPVRITGLSGLPEAGEDFIVVANEREAKEIAAVRMEEVRQKQLQRRKALSLESLLQESKESEKKILNIVLRADVQGSLEAVKQALEGIESDKAEVKIIFSGVGDISESDVQLAAASKAMVLGFHTQVEAHAEPLIKESGVQVQNFDVIYHAVDAVKDIMRGMLDKLMEEEDRGEAEILQVFKASALGKIAGCIVKSGTITRNHKMRVERDGEQIWKGEIASLKRVKDDVKEVSKGTECGILLQGFDDIQEGDKLIAFEIVYHSQEL